MSEPPADGITTFARRAFDPRAQAKISIKCRFQRERHATNHPTTSTRYYRDYERVIAPRRGSSMEIVGQVLVPRSPRRYRPVYPPKFRRPRRRRGTAARTAITPYREISPQPLILLLVHVDVAAPVTHSRHSRQAFPRFRSALLPYRSAMLGGVGEQSEPSSRFPSFSPPPLRLTPLFLFFLSLSHQNADGQPGSL